MFYKHLPLFWAITFLGLGALQFHQGDGWSVGLGAFMDLLAMLEMTTWVINTHTEEKKDGEERPASCCSRQDPL